MASPSTGYSSIIELDLSVKLREIFGTAPEGQRNRANLLGKDTPLTVKVGFGSGAGQQNCAVLRAFSLTAATPAALMLSGTETRSDGTEIDMTSLKGLIVVHFDETNGLEIKQPAANTLAGFFLGGVGGGIIIPPARSATDPTVLVLPMPDGLTVAPTADIIELECASTTTAYVGFWGTE